MARLTKAATALHLEACELVQLDRPLTDDEQLFVLTHWLESATTINNIAGAYFTPLGLAAALSFELIGDRVIDLGAGIGHLAWSCQDLVWRRNGIPPRELVCVERNPDYVAVGRRVLPEATWICANVTELAGLDLGRFDTAIANPPFGTIPLGGPARRYTGRLAEYRFIDVARDLASHGVFIVPQTSAPFRYSGVPHYTEQRTRAYDRFEVETGIQLEPGYSLDTTVYDREWREVCPRVEIVTCDFTEACQRGTDKLF